MKIKLTCIIMFTLAFLCFPENLEITEDYLGTRIFANSPDDPSHHVICFAENNRLDLIYISPQCGNCDFPCQKINYRIGNNRLIFSIDVNTSYSTRQPLYVELEYTLHKSDTSLYFTNYFELENPEALNGVYQDFYSKLLYTLWDYSSGTDAGSVVNINGTNTILISPVIAEVTKGLTVRQAPVTDSPKYTFFIAEYDREFDFLPEGSEVKILGRTQNKVSIGNWTNYWYYIKARLFDPFDSVKLNGTGINYLGTEYDFWAFGEFLEIISDSRRIDMLLDNINIFLGICD